MVFHDGNGTVVHEAATEGLPRLMPHAAHGPQPDHFIIDDLATADLPVVIVGESPREKLLAAGFRSLIAINTRARDQLMGVGFVSKRAHAFSEADVPIARRIVDHIALAISTNSSRKPPVTSPRRRLVPNASRRAYRLLADELDSKTHARVVGESAEWRDVLKKATQVAATDTTVLLMTGVANLMPIDNIDTDMIIPKQYLKTIKRTGLGKGLFSEMRYREDGSENPDFVLNKPAYRKATIIVAGDNFGCGSSREHAPWALLDFGVRCVIATDFADIFYNNCFKNGVLPIRVSAEDLAKLQDDAERGANATLTVDLPGAGDPRPRRRGRQVRDRPLPQAVPDRGPRPHRPHFGRGLRDRRPREEDRRRPPLAVSSPTPFWRRFLESVSVSAEAPWAGERVSKASAHLAAFLPAPHERYQWVTTPFSSALKNEGVWTVRNA